MSTATSKIDWRDWSPETLDLAEREHRPILLAITGSWCHWCHVMDHTTFGDDRVAELVNARFVPIRADTDRRPDLNTRFNMGGWPTVALLTPKADIITGATYLPPAQMIDLLGRVAEVFAEQRLELMQRAEEIRRRREEETELEAGIPGLVTEHIPDGVLRALESAFDETHAGFGTQQKFPHVPALELLLSNYRRTGSRRHLEMATRTLDAMRSGGIFDPVEGGFFRYSTTRDWSVPHYEKMLEDNSGLLSVYAHAYALTGEDGCVETARSIARYLDGTLFDDETRAFFGSQDADEKYYKLPQEGRKKREPPRVDRTIYTNLNGMAADGYLRAYEATGERAHRDRALETIEFIVGSLRRDGCFYHYFDGRPREYGILADQIWAGIALVRAYECTGDRRLVELARDAAECVRSQFADPRGGFFDITRDRQAAERLPHREKLLDENAHAARFFNRLSYYAREESYRRIAESAVSSLAGVYQTYGILSAPYALAVMETIEEPVRVAVAGPRSDSRTEDLLNSALKAKEPSSIVHMLDPASPIEELREFGIEPSFQPQVVVCANHLCRSANDPARVGGVIRRAEGRTVGQDDEEPGPVTDSPAR